MDLLVISSVVMGETQSPTDASVAIARVELCTLLGLRGVTWRVSTDIGLRSLQISHVNTGQSEYKLNQH